jgi:hypothetical protein
VSDLRPGTPGPPAFDDLVTAAEVATVLGAPPDAVALLAHNPSNAVTGGIWVVHAGGRAAVVKVLTDGTGHEGPDWWQASDDDRHWNSWRRELRAYRSDLARHFRPDGIEAPELLRLDERPDGTVVLWLAVVEGRTAAALTTDDVVDVAGRLGRAQGRLAAAGGWDEPWLSRGYLAAYSASKPFDAALLQDDTAWAHPRVARHLAPHRTGIVRLHEERERLLALSAACPRTLCHLDLWPANIIRPPDDRVVLVDWSFCGDGALGEDLGNLIPDSVFDLFLPYEELDDLATRAEAAYIAGVAASPWTGDERWIQLGIRSSAAKYRWLIHRLLAVPDVAAIAYGGREVSRDELYAARAAGLALLGRWAQEALDLGTELGR